MRNKRGLLCLGLVGCLLVGGCQEKEEFAYNEAYVFSHVSFTYSDKTTIEDLSAFIPAGTQISSVEEMESFIKQNLDTYSIIKNEGGQQKRIYLKNELQSITFLGNNQATVVYKGETHTVAATLLTDFDEKRFVVGNAREGKLFSYEDGYVYYGIAFTDDFAIRYIFDNK